MSGPAVGRLVAALQGIYQCRSVAHLKRCLLTEGHEGKHVWSDGADSITWAGGASPEGADHGQ